MRRVRPNLRSALATVAFVLLMFIGPMAFTAPALHAEKADRLDVSGLTTPSDVASVQPEFRFSQQLAVLGPTSRVTFTSLDVLVAPTALDGGSEPITLENIFHWSVDPHLQPRTAWPVDHSRYGFDALHGHLWEIWPETLMIFGGMTLFGANNWNWGSSSFQFRNEGWFGTKTGSSGMDKLGHAYFTYLLTDYITDRIRFRATEPNGAQYSAAALAMVAMTYIEVFDGFSGDHGFSYEDLIANALGAGLSIVRSSIPGLQEKLDFRLEYIPSSHESGFGLASDYDGQKFLLALKLSGFDALSDTPLRFVELHAGYYARGIGSELRFGRPRHREPYAAIGINLQELLFGSEKVRNTPGGRAGRRVFEYLQVPYTYIATENDDW